MHGLALNLSKYWSNFPPSVISDSNIASKLGAGGGRFVFFPSNLSECRGWKVMCSRDFGFFIMICTLMVERLSLVRHPISPNVAFHFYLRSILNEYLGESLVRGTPGVGFFM